MMITIIIAILIVGSNNDKNNKIRTTIIPHARAHPVIPMQHARAANDGKSPNGRLYRKIKHRTMYFNGKTTLYIYIRNIIIQEGIGTPIKTNDRLRRRRVDKRKITPRAAGGRL